MNHTQIRKQKILHLSSAFEIGGLQRLIAHFVQYNSQHNYQYLAILRRSTEGLKLFDREIAVELYEGLSDDEIFIQLKDFIRENSIDIVIAHNRHSWDVATDILKFMPDLRLFFIAHTAITFRRNFENQQEAEKRIQHNSLRTEKVICTSGFVESRLKELLPEVKEKIIRIYNGVEIQKLDEIQSRKKIRDAIRIKDDSVLIGIVSRLAPVKNLGFLLEGICRLVESGETNFKVIIIGDGPEKINLQDKIKQLNLKEYVILKKSTNFLDDYYNALDIYANCSFFESCSMAILEAMSHGLPVIASDVGGNSELVLNEETGFTFSLDNPDEFVEKFRMLLHDAALRSEFGNNGYMRVNRNFNMTDIVERYQELFDTVSKYNMNEKSNRYEKT